MGLDHRLQQLVDMRAGEAGKRDHPDAAQLRQQPVGLGAQLLSGEALVLDEIPFVETDDDRPALALGEIGEREILLLEGDRRVEQQNDDLGEAHGAQRVGDGELLQLLHHARLAAQARRVEQLQLAVAPARREADGIAGKAGLGAGQQPLLAEDAIEQRRLAGVGPAEHGDAQRLRRIDRRPVLVVLRRSALAASSSACGAASGSTARSAS